MLLYKEKVTGPFYKDGYTESVIHGTKKITHSFRSAVYPRKKEENEWVLSVHLFPGKHMYKFVVDGNWIKDQANQLWEQNEYGTGNSVMWFGQ